jgi:site-specific recombinase XerD
MIMSGADSSEGEVAELSLAQLEALARSDVIPARSRDTYLKYFKRFQDWLAAHDGSLQSVTGSVLCAYFKAHEAKYKPSTMWTHFSAIKSVLVSEHNVSVTGVEAVTKFLKSKSAQQVKKRAPIFSQQDISLYLTSAPNSSCLHYKLAVLFQFSGGLRRDEITNTCFEDICREDTFLRVTIRRSKTDGAGAGSTFLILNNPDPLQCPVKLYDEYLKRVPVSSGRFFRQFRLGKFGSQVLGKSW